MEIILQSPNNPICCQVFGLSIRWYGVFLTVALFCGVIISYFLLKMRFGKKSADNFLDISPFLIFFSILGARLFYVIGDFDFYSKNIKEIFLINHGGISILGAISFGIVFCFIYCFFKKINPLKYLDIFAISMPLSQAIGRWGNFFNQEAYGLPSNCFLKLYIAPENRIFEYANINFYHPVFLYESIFDLILFFILLVLFFKFKNLKTGMILCFYLFFYSIFRFFLEYIRIDSVLNFQGLHAAQIISIFFALFSIVLMFLINKKGG